MNKMSSFLSVGRTGRKNGMSSVTAGKGGGTGGSMPNALYPGATFHSKKQRGEATQRRVFLFKDPCCAALRNPLGCW